MTWSSPVEPHAAAMSAATEIAYQPRARPPGPRARRHRPWPTRRGRRASDRSARSRTTDHRRGLHLPLASRLDPGHARNDHHGHRHRRLGSMGPIPPRARNRPRHDELRPPSTAPARTSLWAMRHAFMRPTGTPPGRAMAHPLPPGGPPESPRLQGADVALAECLRSSCQTTPRRSPKSRRLETENVGAGSGVRCEEVDHRVDDLRSDVVTGVGHDGQFAGREGAVGGAGDFDGAEHVAVADEDEGWHFDSVEVCDGVADRLRWCGRRTGRGRRASALRLARSRSRLAWSRMSLPSAGWIGRRLRRRQGRRRSRLDVRRRAVGTGSRSGRPCALRIEVVEAAVVDEASDQVGSAERDERRGGAAFAEPGDEGPIEAQRVDQRDDVVGEHVECRWALVVDGWRRSRGCRER